MKIELEKTMLTGMLTVLGKLVNRSAADRSFLALRLEAKDGMLSFNRPETAQVRGSRRNLFTLVLFVLATLHDLIACKAPQ